MSKLHEILQSGQFPSVVTPRIPWAGTSWRSGKATKRQMDKQRHKPGYAIRAPAVATSAGKDIYVPPMPK